MDLKMSNYMQMNYCKQPSMIVSHLTLNRLFRRTYPGMWASLVVQQRRICLQCRSCRFDPWIGEIPWRRAQQPTPVSLPGESHGQRSLEGYSPRCHKEWDMTERLTLSPTHTNLACSLSSGFSRCSVDILSMNSHFSDILSIK